MPEFKKITNGIRKCKLRLATVVASNTSKRKIYKKMTTENSEKQSKNGAKTEQRIGHLYSNYRSRKWGAVILY